MDVCTFLSKGSAKIKIGIRMYIHIRIVGVSIKCLKLVSLEEGCASVYCIIFLIDLNFFNIKIEKGMYLNKTGLQPREEKSNPLCF